ncbi:CPBP family intramembrane glutamic endopeptidase [Anaerotignum sp.]|uniref:CPBP family intramembrane glutamic endopeptidase n=1 Tax=Anaerotignum sp. TaxID=2039241 RepID=UPI0028A24F51|nr:type II CAAX endopeptidase family protein [Anaerotignum sp.]
MKTENTKMGVPLILTVYIICFVFRGLEYLVLKTDRGVFGEAFLHKLVGISILFFTLRYLSISWKEIGFTKEKPWRFLAYGLLLGIVVFLPAYGAEFIMQYISGNIPKLEWYVTSYSIQGNVGNQTAFIFYILCIVGNIINVVMEEGVFRGLFMKISEKKFSFLWATIFTSFLFGIWHIAAPLRSFLEGQMAVFPACMAMLSLTLMSGLMGAKLCMLTKIFGNLWVPMADHFVNNTIVNVLHVSTASGADQMQVMRIAIAQSLSFFIVLFWYWKTKAGQKDTFRE